MKDFEQVGLSVVRGGMFAALGVVVPFLFHAAGGGFLGKAFEPMILVLFLGGFFVRVEVAAAMSIVTPLFSNLVTGMPPVSPPLLVIVILHALTVSMSASVLFRNCGFHPYLVVPLCILFGKIIVYTGTMVLVSLFDLSGRMVFGLVVVLAGIPGNILEIVIIPPTVLLLIRREALGRRDAGVGQE